MQSVQSEQLLLSGSTIRRLAVSESGFIFDPASGRSFTVNETGVDILRALQRGDDIDEIRGQLAADYEVAPQTLERDLTEFLGSLKDQLS